MNVFFCVRCDVVSALRSFDTWDRPQMAFCGHFFFLFDTKNLSAFRQPVAYLDSVIFFFFCGCIILCVVSELSSCRLKWHHLSATQRNHIDTIDSHDMKTTTKFCFKSYILEKFLFSKYFCSWFDAKGKYCCGRWVLCSKNRQWKLWNMSKSTMRRNLPRADKERRTLHTYVDRRQSVTLVLWKASDKHWIYVLLSQTK